MFERLVIRTHSEVGALEEGTELFDGKETSRQFRLVTLWLRSALDKVCCNRQWGNHVFFMLIDNGANCDVLVLVNRIRDLLKLGWTNRVR